MYNSRDIQRLLRSSKGLMDLQRGCITRSADPQSPLITLVSSIWPRERALITNVVIGPQLGYTGQRRFHNLAQALNWLKPTYSATHHPSQSYQIARFQKALRISDLKEFAQVPDHIVVAWERRHP